MPDSLDHYDLPMYIWSKELKWRATSFFVPSLLCLMLYIYVRAMAVDPFIQQSLFCFPYVY